MSVRQNLHSSSEYHLAGLLAGRLVLLLTVLHHQAVHQQLRHGGGARAVKVDVAAVDQLQRRRKQPAIAMASYRNCV